LEVQVSFTFAFLAGMVSFLSPCILPVVPSYVAFVSGMTLDELRDGSVAGARRAAALHSTFFVLGFSIVFMTMGLVATSVGGPIAQALPWMNRIGGLILILLGGYLTGLLRIPAFARDLHVRLENKPVGLLGSLAVGLAFGAGWTPCIGPILASILLYTSLEATMGQGALLLGTYALGLGIPFVAASLGLNWFLAGAGRVRSWIVPLQRTAGAVLLIIGLMMVTGHFTTLSAFLAGMGQLIDLEMPQ